MNKKILVLCLSVSLVLPTMAMAKKRAKRQAGKIKKGVETGQLTQEEAKKLREDGKAIREEVKSAKADGTVNEAEKAKIKEMRQEHSKNIRAEKIDDEYTISKAKRKRMKKAVRKGKMTQEQVQEIESDSMKIKDQRMTFMKNDNKIDEQEREQLKKMREELKTKVDGYMKK